MFQQAANPVQGEPGRTPGGEQSRTIQGQPKLSLPNSDWVKKILKESIYVDICEAEKTLFYKDIILDGIDYTVHWRCKIDHGRKQRKTKDRIAFHAAGGEHGRAISATSKGRKRKKH